MDRRRLDGGRLVSGGAPGTHGCVSQLVPGGQPALRFRVDESRAHAPPYRQTCAGIRCPSVGLSARARTWLTVSYCYPAVLDNALPAAKVAHVGRCAGEIEWMSRVYRRKYREEDSA